METLLFCKVDRFCSPNILYLNYTTLFDNADSQLSLKNSLPLLLDLLVRCLCYTVLSIVLITSKA